MGKKKLIRQTIKTITMTQEHIQTHTGTVYVEHGRKGHLADGREVYRNAKGEWEYYPS